MNFRLYNQFTNKEEKFLGEYEELCIKYGLEIGNAGCGTCAYLKKINKEYILTCDKDGWNIRMLNEE